MTDRDDLRDRLDELEAAGGADLTDTEAYALLVGAASGDKTAAKRWDKVDTQQYDRLW